MTISEPVSTGGGLGAEDVALRQAIRAAEDELGPEHPTTRQLVARRVNVLIRLGRDAEAASLGAARPRETGRPVLRCVIRRVNEMGDLEATYQELRTAGQAGALSGRQLETLADAAFGTGRIEESFDIREQAYAAYDEHGDELGAGRCATWLAEGYFVTGVPPSAVAGCVGPRLRSPVARMSASSASSSSCRPTARGRWASWRHPMGRPPPRWTSESAYGMPTSRRWRFNSSARTCSSAAKPAPPSPTTTTRCCSPSKAG